jgi:hypothetical protein
MTEQRLVVQQRAVKHLGASPAARVIRSAAEALTSYEKTPKAVWILMDTRPVTWLVSSHSRPRRARSLVVLGHVAPERRTLVRSFFTRVVMNDESKLLKNGHDLLEALTAPHRDDLFIGGAVDHDAKAVVLVRGNIETVVVPFSWFRASGDGTKPDFDDLEITDCGNTVRLGSYEAATDAVLYDFDPDFRKRVKANRLKQDDSFGACLRRLRLLRGVSREGFKGLSAKEVARIERGDITRPRDNTVAVLAKTLKVKPAEIETY